MELPTLDGQVPDLESWAAEEVVVEEEEVRSILNLIFLICFKLNLKTKLELDLKVGLMLYLKGGYTPVDFCYV